MIRAVAGQHPTARVVCSRRTTACLRVAATMWALLGEGPGGAQIAAMAEPLEAPRFDDHEVATLVEQAIGARAFPGAALAAGTAQGPVWSAGYGHLDYDQRREVAADTIYDLASLTKVAGTTAVLMRLTALDRCDPAQPLAAALPPLPAAVLQGDPDHDLRRWRESVTLDQLLRHRGGLPSWRPFHRTAQGAEALRTALALEPPEESPGARYRYSDPGFMWLGEAAAGLGGRPLAELERELLWQPLEMNRTIREVPRRWRRATAPTERRLDGGRGYWHGVVHDENARAGEGQTGHAGLFSTADDLARLAAELLRGHQGRSRLFPREVVRHYTRPTGANDRHALGWQLHRGRAGDNDGGMLSTGSFGHYGFTGTALWIDPQRGVYVVMLTNRVHPDRGGGGWGRSRGGIIDAVLRELDRLAAAAVK